MRRACVAVLAMSQLTAFLSVYKGACKSYGVTPDKQILEDAEKKLAICKSVDKVKEQEAKLTQTTDICICMQVDPAPCRSFARSCAFRARVAPWPSPHEIICSPLYDAHSPVAFRLPSRKTLNYLIF